MRKILAATVTLRSFGQRLLHSDSGQDLIEYALLCMAISMFAATMFPATYVPHFSTIMSKVGSVLQRTGAV